jgi:hypothetical protein
MMLQNYTYVDPMMDPLLLLAVMLGVVLVVATVVALAVSRTSPTSTPAPAFPEAPADAKPFVAPDAYRPGTLPAMPRADNGEWDDSVVYDAMRSADRRTRDRRTREPAVRTTPRHAPQTA